MGELASINGGAAGAAEVASANAEAAKADIVALRQFELSKMSDDEVVTHLAAAREERQHLLDVMGAVILAAEQELEKRIRASGGRAMAHPKFEIEIVEDFGPYRYDLAILNAAANLLPEDERSKIVKHVGETVTVIAAHDEPGNPVSIAALIRRYGADSDVGVLLASAMQRDKTGERLRVKERKAPLPAGGSAR